MDLLYTVESFADISVWNLLIQLFILLSAMLLGNIIRRKIGFVRKSLIPTALIGGLIILVLKAIPAVNDLIDVDIMETLTYHCLGIGFISLALKTSKKTQKTTTKKIIETGLLTGATYTLQAIVGLIVTISLSFFLRDGFFAGGGILLALGFGQGTGQALNYGKIFENDYGFQGGTTFGLTIATIGFIVASVVGVIYMNILRRKGKIKFIAHDQILEEKLDDYVSENEIPNTESVDKFTINFSLVLFVYALVYGIMRLVNINLIWGFNFLIGTILAFLSRMCFNFLKKHQIMHRELTNNYLLDRISGLMFDVMIIAGVAAIDLQSLSSMWWQLAIICTLGTIATFFYVRKASNHLYEGYENEGFFSMFGMLTGTASNGMILLREIDPKFETPAATNVVLSGIPAIIFGGALLLLLGYCPKGVKESLISLAILFIALLIYTLIIYRSKIFKRKVKEKIEHSS